jgi:charged multivesicular body protein 3
VIEEMIQDTLEDDESIEEEAQEEVDKVLFALTDGLLGEAGKVGTELVSGLLRQPKMEQDQKMEERLRALSSI